ncbi:hypothetical protein H5410_041715 [Solanum commersonii]|uniref:Uncharacterized protein n=1 Tax=Solanum commersonii TaxID=4109 RepID=A0A9J5XSN5_SOLCO|nr:hypothetical protein H5410_041715 [Solanum commersonii]
MNIEQIQITIGVSPDLAGEAHGGSLLSTPMEDCRGGRGKGPTAFVGCCSEKKKSKNRDFGLLLLSCWSHFGSRGEENNGGGVVVTGGFNGYAWRLENV